MTSLRSLLAASLLTLASAPALAQVASVPGYSANGTPPSGFQAQGFKLDCNNATPTSGQCWPLMEIWDGTNQATVNSTDHGVTTHVAGGAVQPVAGTTGGATNAGPFYSAASNNATNVKNAAGTLYSITVTQSTTTALELKLYNTSTSPTCSSATAIIDNIPIPSNATSPGYHLTYPVGRAFSTGISFCLVAFGNPAASTDNGNAVTGATVSFTYQ